MEKLTNKEYEDEFVKYLDEGINWGANKHAPAHLDILWKNMLPHLGMAKSTNS
jgi:hypothetical protein